MVVPLAFASKSHAITSVAFSLDIDLDRFAFDSTDGDGDGVADAITFPSGAPVLTFVRFDADDPDGELDVLLADLSGWPFAKGTLLEIELLPESEGVLGDGIRFAHDPPASFGDAHGRGVEGTAVVTGQRSEN